MNLKLSGKLEQCLLQIFIYVRMFGSQNKSNIHEVLRYRLEIKKLQLMVACSRGNEEQWQHLCHVPRYPCFDVWGYKMNSVKSKTASYFTISSGGVSHYKFLQFQQIKF